MPCSIIASSSPASGARYRTRRSAVRAAMPSPTPVIEVNSGWAKPLRKMRTMNDQDQHLRAGGRPVLLGAGGVAVPAEVEDVLHHREADRGESTVDDAVGDAGELAAPEHEQQDRRAERLHQLLDERRHEHRDEALRQAPAVEQAGRAGVDAEATRAWPRPRPRRTRWPGTSPAPARSGRATGSRRPARAPAAIAATRPMTVASTPMFQPRMTDITMALSAITRITRPITTARQPQRRRLRRRRDREERGYGGDHADEPSGRWSHPRRTRYASDQVTSASVKPRLAGRQPSFAVGCPG